MAEICRQCNATVTNAVGRLADLTDKVTEAGVNILALCAWGEGDAGHIMLVADDPEKACEAITPAVDKCDWDEVICVKVANRPGALNEISRRLADAGININLVYASTIDAPEATIVMSTSDNAKAAELI